MGRACLCHPQPPVHPLAPPREHWAPSEETVRRPEPSIPGAWFSTWETPALGTSLPTVPELPGLFGFCGLARICARREQVSRWMPACKSWQRSGALLPMVLFCCHGTFHPRVSEPLASRGLFPHQQPHGAGGELITY